MYATDFEYDGLALSDFGMMIGSFSSPGVETVNSGASINFQTFRPAGSERFRFYGGKYEESFTAVFQICKCPWTAYSPYLSPVEVSALQRWLCRKDGYHRLHFVSKEHADIYWNAVFSSRQINVSGRTAGLELTLYTDAPYAYRKEQTNTWILSPGGSFFIYDTSDEEGYIYPFVTIQWQGSQSNSGKIKLSNSMDHEDFPLLLQGFSANDIITLDGASKIITSSPKRTDLHAHFGFHFPRIINTLECRENIFTLSADSVPCKITFTYSPIIKTGI